VKCTICPSHRPWIDRKNLGTHLVSEQHKKCVEAIQEAAIHQEAVSTAREADLQARREAENVSVGLHQVHFDDHQMSEVSRVPSAAETAMWEDFEMNGAEFTAGSDAEAEERDRYEKQEQEFGVWNSDTMAGELGGFGDGDEFPVARPQEDEDEEILSDILHNAREFQNDVLLAVHAT
jgi:hypothetical protein